VFASKFAATPGVPGEYQDGGQREFRRIYALMAVIDLPVARPVALPGTLAAMTTPLLRSRQP
jgi:hypothetical protein